MTAPENELIVTPTASSVRAAVGPYAWVVLEELASAAHVDAGRVVVEASVRDLASTTGLAKDTVARAMGRLIDAGVVERTLNRDTGSGRFGRAVCTLRLDVAGIEIPQQATADPPRPTRPDTAPRGAAGVASRLPARVPAKREPSRSEGQLSFLDDAGTVA